MELFLNYFSENLIQAQPKISPKKSIKELEKTAQKIAETFNADDFQFQSKVKSAIFNNIEENNELSPEKLANDLFDNNLTARLSLLTESKKAVPEPVQFDEIDASRQLKRFENQKLSLSNGIELIVPNKVYQDAESVEFIQMIMELIYLNQKHRGYQIIMFKLIRRMLVLAVFLFAGYKAYLIRQDVKQVMTYQPHGSRNL